MNLKDKTTLIQHELLRRGQKLPRFGTDGDYGTEMADALIVELGIKPAQSGLFEGIITGTGENISRIFIHCTATREGQDIDAATIRKWHLNRGWRDIGYHFVIGLDGTIEKGRPEHIAGSHVRGFNTGSIGVVYVGGLAFDGSAKDTRTEAQKQSMAALVTELNKTYPGSRIMGHRDASPDLDGDGKVERHEWLKDCPCFDVELWWNGIK